MSPAPPRSQSSPVPVPDIAAARLVPAPIDSVFAFLSDLGSHWLIADRFVEVLELEGPRGARHGGRVRVRGPLGLRRTAVTRVDAARHPSSLVGSARIGSRTHAVVRWILTDRGPRTGVRLEARVEASSRLDRILLALGGRWWLQRRFVATLNALAERSEAGRDDDDLRLLSRTVGAMRELRTGAAR